MRFCIYLFWIIIRVCRDLLFLLYNYLNNCWCIYNVCVRVCWKLQKLKGEGWKMLCQLLPDTSAKNWRLSFRFTILFGWFSLYMHRPVCFLTLILLWFFCFVGKKHSWYQFSRRAFWHQGKEVIYLLHWCYIAVAYYKLCNFCYLCSFLDKPISKQVWFCYSSNLYNCTGYSVISMLYFSSIGRANFLCCGYCPPVIFLCNSGKSCIN